MPTMNPDGYERSKEGDDSSAQGRGNANDIDLNRNFPDQYSITQYNKHPEPETKAVMEWFKKYPFVLSANLHGGALVVNYPYDDNRAMKSGVKNVSPDNDIFVLLAKTYSDAHPRMHKGLPCPEEPKEKFPEGIVNGAVWYVVSGGMQDYNYLFADCFEVTIEMGCFKYPYAKKLPGYWMENREPLIKFIEQVHRGVHGFVWSTGGNPIPNATISVEGINHDVHTAADGDYWRLLAPRDNYIITASADGYESQKINVTVTDSAAGESVNFTLLRDDPRTWAIDHDFGLVDNVDPVIEYVSFEDLKERLASFEASQPSLAEFKETAFSTPYLKISNEAGAPHEGKLNILIIGNLYGTELAGREIALRIAKHLLSGYQDKDADCRKLLSNAVVHVVPVVDNYFDRSESLELSCHTADPRMNLFASVLASKNPKSSKTVEQFLSLLKNEEIDFLFSLEGGGITLSHPHVGEDHVLESIYQMLDEVYIKKRPLNAPNSCRESGRNSIGLIKQKVLNYLSESFDSMLPVSVRLSCCNYNEPNKIPQIWRNSMDQLMNLLLSVNQGIEGFVQDTVNVPMREAIVKINSSTREFHVSRDNALFRITLPPGNYRILVSCPHHEQYSVDVVVLPNRFTSLGVKLIRIYDPYNEPVSIKHSGTGVAGYVMDINNHPIPGAVISEVSGNKSAVANKDAVYWLPLTLGEHPVKASAGGYHMSVKLVTITDKNKAHTVIFKLIRDETVMGLPRLAFITLAGISGMLILLMCFCCYIQCIQRRRSTSYKDGFSLLPEKSYLFHDDDDGVDGDDDKDTELFRTPIRDTDFIARPYYDESDVEHDDGSSGYEEDMVVVKK